MMCMKAACMHGLSTAEDGGGKEKGSLTYISNACRAEYKAYRNCISQLVYVETAFKLEGPTAFSLYDY